MKEEMIKIIALLAEAQARMSTFKTKTINSEHGATIEGQDKGTQSCKDNIRCAVNDANFLLSTLKH